MDLAKDSRFKKNLKYLKSRTAHPKSKNQFNKLQKKVIIENFRWQTSPIFTKPPFGSTIFESTTHHATDMFWVEKILKLMAFCCNVAGVKFTIAENT